MKRELNKLYEYCKSKGYNESREKFEEDLRQLMVEELGSEELSKVSGGKKGINAVTAGLISALSVAAPLVSAQQAHFDGNKVMTPVSDTTKVNQDSQRKTTEDMKSKINLKNIPLGVGGVSLLGNVVLASAVLSQEPIWSKFDFKKNDVKKLNKVIEEVLFELEKDSIRQLKDFYVGLSKTDKCAFWGKYSVSSESTLLLLEKMFAERHGASTAEDFGFHVRNFIINAFSKGNNAKQIAQDLKTDITQNGVYEWYTLGGKTYIPISLLSSLDVKQYLGKMTKPHRAAIKEDFDDLTRDIGNDFGKVIKETDMFDNTTSTDIYSYNNITFSMFLDVCVELLRGCPANLDIKFDEKVTSKQDVDSAFYRCLDAIKGAWAKGNNSAARIAESLKNEDFLKTLKDKIILDNNNDDENAKWNAVGIALLTTCEKGNYHKALSKNWSYVDSRAHTYVEPPVHRFHLRYQLLPLTIEEKSKDTD